MQYSVCSYFIKFQDVITCSKNGQIKKELSVLSWQIDIRLMRTIANVVYSCVEVPAGHGVTKTVAKMESVLF